LRKTSARITSAKQFIWVYRKIRFTVGAPFGALALSDLSGKAPMGCSQKTFLTGLPTGGGKPFLFSFHSYYKMPPVIMQGNQKNNQERTANFHP
jgi:hypothetical protein